ncbi:hypothetical protein HLH12_15975 [Acinetobacter sp. NIPH 2377]|uniref:hypothetical protein n=1 Tax=Acinetobacter terrestris TaxID=2529843 RepID=UPI0014900AA3|nr:hypothetical protein [Acinetobacter terrestris]NNH37003.1 hypothetical protein [Acinetobacter terrestris]
MSSQDIKQAIAELKPRAKEVHEAAKVIAAEGKPINDDWIEDIGDAEKKWEKCTIKLKVRANERKYSEWLEIILDDGTVILSTYYYITDYSSEFEINTFRNGGWVDRLINYSTENVIAEKERKKKAELEQLLKPFSSIDF